MVSPQGCSLPWREVEDAVLSPLHLLQGFINADGDVVVLPFAHNELHIFAVESGATTESLQMNYKGKRGQGRIAPGANPNQGTVGSIL